MASEAGEVTRDVRGRLRAWRVTAAAGLARLDPWRVAAVVAALSVMHVIVGSLVSVLIDPDQPWLGLDAEIEVPSIHEITVALPALWSAALLSAAGLAWLVASLAWESGRAQLVAAGFGFGLAFLALDELVYLHERLEKRVGIDWQVLYAPLGLVLAGMALLLFRQAAAVDRRSSFALLAGCVCWAAAQLFELVQWSGDEKVGAYLLLMIPEEASEVAGSILFGLAALLLVRARFGTDADPARRRS